MSGVQTLRRFLLLAAVLASSVGLYRFLQGPAAPPSAPSPPSPPSTEATPRPTEALPPAAGSLLKPRPLTTNPEPAEPDLSDKNTVVEFEIKNGWAVLQKDILLGKVEDTGGLKRARTELARPRVWPSPVIPYVIQPRVAHPERIEKAIRILGEVTPIQLVPHTGQPDALIFEAGSDHCQSFLGQTGGLQPIYLTEDCQTQQILHEILHALGFIHEHARPERDRVLEVLWDQIDPPYKEQFARMSEAFMDVSGLAPFDSSSVMMYAQDAFSLHPPAATLRLKNAPSYAPAPEGLGPSDVARLKALYPTP